MASRVKADTASKTSSNADSVTGLNSTRQRLLDVGLEQMRKHGYGATGLQELLRAADVPKGSFYHHFGSKEEFAGAVIERYVALVGQLTQEILGNTRQAPLKRLRRYFEELIRSAGQSAPIPGCLLGSLSLEVAAVSPRLQGHLRTSFTGWQDAVASVLREAVEAGDLPKSAEPDSLAGFVLNGWEGALLRSQADRSDAALKNFVHYVFDEMLAKKGDRKPR
jgi:TetR/AcrR family transcriptional regulator, transcriptional repressor for nem operon